MLVDCWVEVKAAVILFIGEKLVTAELSKTNSLWIIR